MPKLPRPQGYATVTPYLVVQLVREVMRFIERAFGAVAVFPPMIDDGRVVHAEFRIGDSVVMMAEASDEWKAMPAMLHVYVDEEVDLVYRRALEAGATSLREPADQFYGDRSATVRDACGNVWSIANHVEDVSPEEIARRVAAMKQSGAKGQ
jgi:PhnB protein